MKRLTDFVGMVTTRFVRRVTKPPKREPYSDLARPCAAISLIDKKFSITSIIK